MEISATRKMVWRIRRKELRINQSVSLLLFFAVSVVVVVFAIKNVKKLHVFLCKCGYKVSESHLSAQNSLIKNKRWKIFTL